MRILYDFYHLVNIILEHSLKSYRITSGASLHEQPKRCASAAPLPKWPTSELHCQLISGSVFRLIITKNSERDSSEYAVIGTG
jgi:hypothetical protein